MDNIMAFFDFGEQKDGSYLSEYWLESGKKVKNFTILCKSKGLYNAQTHRLMSDQLKLESFGISEKDFYEFHEFSGRMIF